MSGWETELAEKKLAFQEAQNDEEAGRQFSKQQEAAFWQAKVALTVAGSADNLAARKRAADAGSAVVAEQLQHRLATYQTEEAAFKNNTDAKLELLNQEATFAKLKFGDQSKEYDAAQKKIVETKRQAAEQQRQIDAIRADEVRSAIQAEIELESQHAQLQLDMGQITQEQLLQKQQDFENRKFQIVDQALRERLALLQNDRDLNRVAIEQMNEQIRQAEEQHQSRISQIRNQATLAETAISRDAANKISGDMQSSLSKMMQGQLSFAAFFKSTWESVRAAVADSVSKMFMDWLKTTEAWAAVERLLSVFKIQSAAATGGANSASSAAETPVVGWAMAAPAGAATFAMISAFAGTVPSFSAAGGFDIPGTINPMVQAHANEMILPAKHADVIRSLADQGGAPRGGDIHIHNVQTWDSKDMARSLLDNNSAVMKALRRAQRDFK